MKAPIFIVVMIFLLGAGIALGDESSGDFTGSGSGSTSTTTTTTPATEEESRGTSGTTTADPHANGVNFEVLRDRSRNQPPVLSKDPTMNALLKTLVTIKKQTDLTVHTVLAIRSRLDEQGEMRMRLPQVRRAPRLGYPDNQLNIEGTDPIDDLVALHSCLNHIGSQQKFREDLPLLFKKVNALIDRAEEASNSGLLVSGVLIVVMIALAAIVMVFLLITSSRERRGLGYRAPPTTRV
ncbi:ORF6 [Silurid herpesvirus 1]|nr:ORF6 [Silurid herpesvirus 1]AVP72256.1 ORF6 [Silurid herpesvirus 1]